MGLLLGYNKILQIRLEQSNNTKSQFLSRMNHELRTPMNAIIGFAQLLGDDDNLTEEQQDEVRRIIGAGNHTLALINELLDFASIETGKINLSLMELSPLNVMTHSIEMTQSLADKNSISIEHNIPKTQPANIVADEVRLTEIFINLLSNAIKYNKENGHIKIDYLQKADRTEIVVSDNGIGIDKTQMPYLFEPFNRLGAEKTKIEGTGVGLSITRSLVEMMKGNITCKSEPNEGTCFFLSFPSEKGENVLDHDMESSQLNT